MLGQGVYVGDDVTRFVPDLLDHRPRDFAAELGLDRTDVIDLDDRRGDQRRADGRGVA